VRGCVLNVLSLQKIDYIVGNQTIEDHEDFAVGMLEMTSFLIVKLRHL
jgi:hypothetical protein